MLSNPNTLNNTAHLLQQSIDTITDFLSDAYIEIIKENQELPEVLKNEMSYWNPQNPGFSPLYIHNHDGII